MLYLLSWWHGDRLDCDWGVLAFLKCIQCTAATTTAQTINLYSLYLHICNGTLLVVMQLHMLYWEKKKKKQQKNYEMTPSMHMRISERSSMTGFQRAQESMSHTGYQLWLASSSWYWCLPESTSLHALQEPTWTTSPGTITERYKIIFTNVLDHCWNDLPNLIGTESLAIFNKQMKTQNSSLPWAINCILLKTSISLAIPWSLPVPACTSNTVSDKDSDIAQYSTFFLCCLLRIPHF